MTIGASSIIENEQMTPEYINSFPVEPALMIMYMLVAK